MAPLDPFNLTPPISLNRVRIIDLPGLGVDPGVLGKTGYELVSAAARDAARDAAQRLGRNLGYLLLTLRRGDPVNRAGRAEWDDSYWAHWAGIRQVWLGGGLVSGDAGLHLIDHARDVIAEGGISDLALHRSPYGQRLPLVGAARAVPADCPAALVFDFGHTMIKRAVALYREGTLVELRDLLPVQTHFEDIPFEPADPAAVAVQVRDMMVRVIVDTWQDLPSPPLFPTLPVSLAAYVHDGQPLAAQAGAYVQLRHITDNAEQMLSERISEALDRPVGVKLIHDGTAAAAAHAGLDHAAVITIGTALGIGFPPSDAGLRQVEDV